MSNLIALCLPHAWAFAPNASAPAGLQLEPQRIQYVNPAFQSQLMHTDAWRDFVEGDGQGWQVRFDEHTRTPRVLWGRGVPMPTVNVPVMTSALESWLDRQAELIGYEPGDLSFASANYSEDLDMWYVSFDVLRSGLPTYRGGVRARIKHGNLILVHVATAPDAPVTGDYVLGRSEAIATAIRDGLVPEAIHTDTSAEKILMDRKDIGGHELRRTWMVRSNTASPPGRWVTFVDSATGEILNVHNDVRFANGVISGEHHERTVDGQPLVTSPMPYSIVSTNNGDTATADEVGAYTVPNANQYATDLDGGWLQVLNSNGGEGSLSGQNPDLTWDGNDATQAEIDTYVFTHQVKAWGELVAPTVPAVTDNHLAYVNINDNCNAYWDGNINFFQKGSGCNNTGQIADVVYHEWGHGFHYWSSFQNGFFDGSLSEGAADATAFFQTGDRIIAPFFLTNGAGIRDVEPNKVYPQDYSNNAYLVHSNGLIYGGTIWDLWGLLEASEGPVDGKFSAELIHAAAIKGGTDIPGTYFEALAGDDNDGDLSNGTPHICEINEAFGAHGIGPSGQVAPAILTDHAPLEYAAVGDDHQLSVDLVEVSVGCATANAQNATIHWRALGGNWEQSSMSTSAGTVAGSIPAQPFGTVVEYYIEGRANQIDFAVPSGANINPYTFIVGDVIEIACDDFEADDAAYTHSLVAGEIGDGADDWQWGAPAGQSGDPAVAYSGQMVWGNDLGQSGFNGAYQANKVNRLVSEPFQTGHYTDVLLQYRRWLNIQDGSGDQAVILANGQPIWSNWEGNGGDHHQDGSWNLHLVDLDGAGDQGEVRFSWEMHSNATQEFGGWTLDDVCAVAPATADNRLGITDFEATALEDILVGLSWTNPIHDPVQEVRVVRRFNDTPAAYDDGDIVFEDTDPVAGEFVEAEDINYHAGDSFYAVYAYDGTAWLSWTIEGWNADAEEIEGGEAPPGWPTDTDGDGLVDGGPDGLNDIVGLNDKKGCGCSSPFVPGAPGAVWGLAALALVSTRRRRA